MEGRVLSVIVVVVLATTGVASGTTTTPQAGSQQASCDYVSLYEQTIDSVVAVESPIGLGTGLVYRTAENNTSYVVTNAHVVGEAAGATVRFTEGESVSGTVVGRDVFADLAVVQVNQTPDYVESLSVVE